MAARCRVSWDRLDVAGSGLILQVLKNWRDGGDVGEGIVVVAYVRNGNAVRSVLQELDKRKVSIRWVVPADSKAVQSACAGLAHVHLFTGNTLREAFEGSGLPSPGSAQLSDDIDRGKPEELGLYLRYKIAMSFIGDRDPRPLVEASDALAKVGSGGFLERHVPAGDRASVREFAKADFPYLAGYSPRVRDLKERIRKVGRTDLRTLIIGETGTGKESVAFYLHEFSDRRGKPLLALNCASLEAERLRSELFGHVKGAYTGAANAKTGLVEEADGGTLFLDEVAEMSPAVQAALLRFLQDGRFIPLGATKEKKADVRIVAATQPDLFARIDEGRFRADLYYRLAEVEIRTPCLRDIPEDISTIVTHILFGTGAAFKEIRRAGKYFGEWNSKLRSYPWPGNVRELARLVKRRLLLGDDVVADLAAGAVSGVAGPLASPAAPRGPAKIRPLADIIKEYVREADRNRGNLTQRQLAKRLGKAVNTVKRILNS